MALASIAQSLTTETVLAINPIDARDPGGTEFYLAVFPRSRNQAMTINADRSWQVQF